MRRTGALLATILLLTGCTTAAEQGAPTSDQPAATPVAASPTPTPTPTPTPEPSTAVAVPDVIGMSLADAQATLAQVGLIGTASTGGTVVTGQQPAAGLSVWAPQYVALTLDAPSPEPAGPTPAPSRTYAAYALDAAIAGATPYLPAGADRAQTAHLLTGICDLLDTGASLDDVDATIADVGTPTARRSIIAAAVGGLCPAYIDAALDWMS